MGKTVYVKIDAEAENHAEKFIHEIRKEADNARRYGVNVSVERVELESDDNTEFTTGNDQ